MRAYVQSMRNTPRHQLYPDTSFIGVSEILHIDPQLQNYLTVLVHPVNILNSDDYGSLSNIEKNFLINVFNK